MKDSDKNKESSHLKYWNVNNLYDGQCHVRNLKQALNHELILKKTYQRGIKFKQKDWLKR